MTVTAKDVIYSTPAADDQYHVLNASGTALEVNPGDWVAFSGQHIIAAHDGVGYWKASGVGVALDRNPIYDWAGRALPNTALLVATRGTFRVSANFSGQPNLGVIAFPDMTGSGVNAASGVTGLGAVWNTALPSIVSGGTAANAGKGVAQVVAWHNTGPAGTGQMDVRVWSRNGDFY